MASKHELYDTIYGLLADGGREEALLGDTKALAREAFTRSICGEPFPILWFELPMQGKPRFDLHVAITREALSANPAFAPGAGNGYDRLFSWYGKEEQGGGGLAFAYDVGDGRLEDPAIHVNVNNSPLSDIDRFFELASGPDAVRVFHGFADSIPSSWNIWYTGVHPGRPGSPVRVDCFVSKARKHDYAHDPKLLEEDLRSCGFSAISDDLYELAGPILASPFRLELQFDVLLDGSLGPTLGLSAGFGFSAPATMRRLFAQDGPAAALYERCEQLGLADERWRLLSDALFATRFELEGEPLSLYCLPTFIKLRMREGKMLDAKTYLQAGAM